MRRWVQLLLLLWGSLALTACGSALPTATLVWRVAPQVSTSTAVPQATATTPSAAQPASTAVAIATPTLAPTPRPTVATPVIAQRASPTTASPHWTEVARWQGSTIIVTDPFNVRGPWRICWQLPSGDAPFTVMVGTLPAGTWELMSGQPGATVGRFDETPGGTFQLMLHNTTPYTVVVEDAPAGGLPPSLLSQPCPGS